MKQYPYLKSLIFIVVVVRLLSFLGVSFFGIGLAPDEAQYWTWSQNLSYGYYSKPPGIAWEIASGTFFFGNTELGVRFVGALLGTALSVSIYFLALKVGLEAFFAFLAAATFSLSPVGIFSGVLATTDCGFLLFWVWALTVVAKALSEEKNVPWMAVGVLIAFGSLFKWTIFLLWIPLLVLALVRRDSFFKVCGAFLLSLVGIVPSLLWNYTHDFATVRHVFSSVTPHGEISHSNPISFFFAQFGVASPLLFVLILVSTASFIAKARKLPSTLLLSLGISVGFFALVIGLACIKKVQVNWAIAAYPTAFVVLVSWARMHGKKALIWLYSALVLSVVCCLSAPYITTVVPYKMNFLKENVGWTALHKGLIDIGYNPDFDVLFADRYQTTSLLSFYAPQQKIAYFLNLNGIRKNQFSYWQREKPLQIGAKGFYVAFVEGDDVIAKAYQEHQNAQKKLKAYFNEVAETYVCIPLYRRPYDSSPSKVALVVRVAGFNGKLPSDGTSW